MPTAPTIITHRGIDAFVAIRPETDGVVDGRQRPDGIGHVVGAMRKAQQSGGENQRHGEQPVDALLGVLQADSGTPYQPRGKQ